MASLTICLRRTSKLVSKDDVSVIQSAHDEYVSGGMTSQEASIKAVDDLLAEAMADRQNIIAEVAKKAARSAGKNLHKAGHETAVALLTLFDTRNRLGSGPSFDEDTYAAAMPHFKAALQHFGAAGSDAATAIRALVNYLADVLKMSKDGQLAMKPYIVRFLMDTEKESNQTTPKEEENVSATEPGLERDRADVAPEDGVGQEDVQNVTGDVAVESGRGAPDTSEDARRSGRSGVPSTEAAPSGTGSDIGVQGEPSGDVGRPARSDERRRSPQTGPERLSFDEEAARFLEGVAREPASLNDAIAAQKKADETVPYLENDPENIRESLPMLKPAQREDVIKAEARLTQPDAYGFLFTNGTGTGKTYSGLGVIKRFQKQGKTNVLVVAPSQGILDGWIEAAKNMGVPMSRLEDTKSAGEGTVATTYKNLEDNMSLASRQWDLIVADESHTFSQNKSGNPSRALMNFRAISNKTPRDRAMMRLSTEKAALDELESQSRADRSLKERFNSETIAFYNKLESESQSIADEPRSKVLFLSATPFAYHKSTDYAEGYLFNYPERKGGYNDRGGQEEFLVRNFGYRMRYGRAEQPDANVNIAVMERQFHEKLKRDGVLSGRQLELEADYDRRFILVDDAVGSKIDQALEWLNKEKDGRYSKLAEEYEKRFNHLAKRRLLEAIKATHVIDEIKRDLDLGRKIVVFHDFNEGGGFNPFEPPENINGYPSPWDARWGSEPVTFGRLHSEFVRANPYVRNLDFSEFKSPIETLTQAFPDALVYNGTISNKKRAEAKKMFNQDGSGRDLIIVQSQAGQAGISLHDTTGSHQRIQYNLGLPTRPTMSIQQEGRIYREGQVSNAIIRYMSTGTSWESRAFAQTIAERASTAENLALGDGARALRDSFIDAFNEASAIEKGAHEGVGGKQRDRIRNSSMTEFERAKTYYYAEGKTSARRDQRDGVDYFATPEPIGLKMVEFADVRRGERILEPSAGHGAIARWFPEGAERTIIEPSVKLGARAELASPGSRLIATRFEDHHITNKYDAIVMNPPFGSSSKTAFEHMDKAVRHLRDNGRIVAVLPRGPAADARFEKFIEQNKDLSTVATFIMPPVMFERAGTKVPTRLVVLEKSFRKFMLDSQTVDLSDVTDINDLFDKIEDAKVEPRATDGAEVMAQYQSRPTKQAEAVSFKLGETNHGKTGDDLFVATFEKPVAREVYDKINKIAKDNGGYYSSYQGGEAIRGFQFKSAEDRQKFIDAASSAATPVVPSRGYATQTEGVQAAYRLVTAGKPFTVPDHIAADTLSGIDDALDALPRHVDVGALRQIEVTSNPDLVNVILRKRDGTLFRVRNIAFEQIVTPDGGHAAAFFVLTDDGPVISLMNFGGREGFGVPWKRGKVWHETIHALRRSGVLDDQAFVDLVRHAENLRVLDMPIADFQDAIGGGRPDDQRSLREVYSTVFSNSSDFDEMIAQESVAHFIELVTHDYWLDSETAPVQRHLDAIFSGAMWSRRSQLGGVTKADALLAGLSGPTRPSRDVEDARLERARAMGFDTSTVYYHGSRLGSFDKFDKSFIGRDNPGVRAKGFYFANNYGEAHKYARQNEGDNINGKRYDVNNPLHLAAIAMRATKGDADAAKINLARNDRHRQWRRTKWQKAIKAIDDGVVLPSFDPDMTTGVVGAYYLRLRNPLHLAIDETGPTQEEARSAGHDGIIFGNGDEVVVFDEENIRSTDAAFDPSSDGEPLLLGSKRQDGIPSSTQSVSAKVIDDALEIVGRIAGPKNKVVFQKEILDEKGNHLEGQWTPALDGNAIIKLAMDSVDMRTYAGHEAWHHVEERLATDAERRLLRSGAETGRMRRLAAQELGIDASSKEMMEMDPREIRAIAFQRYRRLLEEGAAGAAGLHIGVRRFFDRMVKLFAAVRNGLAGHGFTTYESLFEKARTGEIASRGAPPAQKQATPGILDKSPFAVADMALGARRMTHAPMALTFLRQTAPTTWLRNTKMDALRQGIQDSALPLRRVQELVQQVTGTNLPLQLDVYNAEALSHGRIPFRLEEFKDRFVEPLIEHMRTSGIDVQQLGEYAYAVHAEERNNQIGKYYEPGEQFHDAMTDHSLVGGSGMSTDEANAIKAKIASGGKQAEFDRAIAMVKDMHTFTLDALSSAGLIDAATKQKWSTQFANYMPLRGWEDDPEALVAMQTGKGFDVRGPESQQALGRYSTADNPILYSITQAEQAIARAEHNRVMRRFANLIEQNPDPNLWKIHKGTYRRRLVKDPVTGDKKVEQYFVAAAFSSRDPGIIGYKVAGKQKYIWVGDERLERAVKGNDRAKAINDSSIVRYIGTATRAYAKLLTTWNPEFMIANMPRDVETALFNSLNVSDNPKEVMKKILADAMSLKAIRGVMAGLRDHTNTTIIGTPRSKAAMDMAAWFKQYQRAGGQISYMDYNSVESIRKNIEKSLKAGNTRRAFRSVVQFMEDANTAVENGTRLSVFMALRKQGVAEDKAAFIAREITVNFNRKGDYGTLINSAWLFFNASLQGPVRMAQTIARSKAARYGLIALVALGAIADMFGYLMAGDDDDGQNAYDKIPEWIKQRNLVLMTGGGKNDRIQIPLGYGLNAFIYGGMQLSAMARGASGNGGRKDYGKAAVDTALTFWESFNPLGSTPTVLQTLAPTMLDPLVQMAENTNWNGQPIYPVKYDRHKPDSELFFSSAPRWMVEMSRALNKATGGNEARSGNIDISPETLDHLAQFAMGGVGKLVLNAVTTGQRFAAGDEWLPEKTPLIRRVYARDTLVSRRRDFYQAWNEVDQANYEVRTLAKDGDAAGSQAARKEYAKELSVYSEMKAVSKALSSYKKQADKIREDKNLSDRDRQAKLDEITRRENGIIIRVMRNYNTRVKGIVSRPAVE